MNCHLSEITELKYTSLIKMIILEENVNWSVGFMRKYLSLFS